MNVFVPDPDPVACSQMLATVHVGKMLMEAAQMLSTWEQVYDPSLLPSEDGLCVPTHRHHPVTVWVGTSRSSAQWVFDYAYAMAAEFAHRTGKPHGAARRLPVIKQHLDVIPAGPMPPFYAEVPGDLRHLDVHEAYRQTLRRKYREWVAARAAGNKRKPEPKWHDRTRPEWSI